MKTNNLRYSSNKTPVLGTLSGLILAEIERNQQKIEPKRRGDGVMIMDFPILTQKSPKKLPSTDKNFYSIKPKKKSTHKATYDGMRGNEERLARMEALRLNRITIKPG